MTKNQLWPPLPACSLTGAAFNGRRSVQPKRICGIFPHWVSPACHLDGLGFVRVGNTPWFRRVRWTLELCCFTPAPGEEASGSGQKFRCFLFRAWRWAEPVARLPQENQETHKPERTPRSSLEIGLSFCFAAFHNNNSNMRPPGAYRAMSHGACCLLW